MNFFKNHPQYNKYSHRNRNISCSNSRFDVCFDHLINKKNQEVNDFLIVKPKVSNQEKVVGVCILPQINNKFHLMLGWRHQFDANILQAPSGFLEEGEQPEEAAIRELAEETSYICKPEDLISLGSYLPDAGLIEGRVSLYLALNCKNANTPIDREIGTGEIIELTTAELREILTNEINIGGSTLVTSYRAIDYLDNKISKVAAFI